MPLQDHQKLPPGVVCSWEGFHTLWASWMTHELNTRRLPRRYRAEPLTQAGASVEADVSAFEEDEALPLDGEEEGGVATATAVWAPPAPPLATEVEFGNLDVYEVRVYSADATRALVAAVELVSPANKDRPAHRQAFATTCAAYLQQNVSVIVVDIVTERRSSLHEEVLRRLELDRSLGGFSGDLYAVAYRTAGIGTRMKLEAWPHALKVGADLPTLPLWLAPQLAVPLDLEATYRATCTSLRIPV